MLAMWMLVTPLQRSLARCVTAANALT